MCEKVWRLEPHLCRTCQGRIVSASVKGAVRQYLCSNCGQVAQGKVPSVLCCCGMTLRRGDLRHPDKMTIIDAGVRCQENRNVSPEFPGLYVAEYIGKGAGI